MIDKVVDIPSSRALVRAKAEAAYHATGQWLEAAGYAGNDPYQLDNVFSQAGGRRLIGPVLGFARKILKPYHALIPKRMFAMAPAIRIPQALGDAISGEGMMPESPAARRRAEAIFQLIRQTRSPLAKNDGWGLPFVWGGAEPHPRHWPTTISTTIVLGGILDAIDLLERDAVLAMGESAVRFLLDECGVAQLPEGDCIFFGPGDRRLILNVSAAAAGVIARLGMILGREDLLALSGRCAALVCHHQNPDGSWFYAPAYDGAPVDMIIDSRHTGYILEGLASVRDVCGDADGSIQRALDRGWAYVKASLLDGDLPRWSPTETWPVDAHDMAQAIMTALTLGERELAERHVVVALDRFYLGQGMFRYKAFAQGGGNDAVFIRWSQAPMFRALGKFLRPEAPARTE